MTLIYDLLIQAAIKAEDELATESGKVTVLLAECGREKVQPPKDYWHKKYALQNKVDALRKLIGD